MIVLDASAAIAPFRRACERKLADAPGHRATIEVIDRN